MPRTRLPSVNFCVITALGLIQLLMFNAQNVGKTLRQNCRLLKAFFVQRAIEHPEQLDSEYAHCLEQMFQLKTHGKLSFIEMDMLTAEDRKWWMERLKKHNEEQEKASKNSGSVPNMPQI